MKLNTLKDLKSPYIEGTESDMITKIKIEAIKWVKAKLRKEPSVKIKRIYYEDGLTKIDWELKKQDKNDFYAAGFIFAHVDFHNITEDDLK